MAAFTSGDNVSPPFFSYNKYDSNTEQTEKLQAKDRKKFPYAHVHRVLLSQREGATGCAVATRTESSNTANKTIIKGHIVPVTFSNLIPFLPNFISKEVGYSRHLFTAESSYFFYFFIFSFG